jgi:proteasome lid subunit RPN8/RPN11
MTEKEPAVPVSAGQWKDRGRPVRRVFPGPRGALVPLRVALSRRAYADVTAHARESLDQEVCGVFAGAFCEDDEGTFVEVEAALRGVSARQGRGHVTFTQETWNAVHGALERDHPGLLIVGWYHTHPGFGVEFSEMDVFIQRNFFPGPSQVALVMDPLGGSVGLATAGGEGVRYLDRFYVDGREHNAQTPTSTAGGNATAGREALVQLEAKVSQLAVMVHDLRSSLQRFLLAAGLLVALGVAAVVVYAVSRTFYHSVRPPEQIAFVPVPLMLEGKPAVVGLAVVRWELPDELLALSEPIAPPRRPSESASPPGAPSPSVAPSSPSAARP